MLNNYSLSLQQERRWQYLAGFFCLFVYGGSLFFPLMDKDAAHHANIALYMYEHNDWVSLVDRQKDYLDKPHFLFWSSLLSFKLFGVNTFAHRLPAVLFALLSILSTYKLSTHLSGKRTARIAALMLATGQAFVLAINDARMETPLTAGIITAIWQLVLYVDKNKFIHLVLAALAAAMAFATKGWLGPVVVFISIFFYLLTSRKWKVLASPLTWLFIPLFFVFISPVLYAYYLQYDLHPEKVIRGQSGRSGLGFILWKQLFERAGGFDVKGRNSEYFFLYHTFLWAFLPWSLIAYAALFYWLRRIVYLKKWKRPLGFAPLAFSFILFSISFSKFKMPHYIIMLLPLAAIFTAPYLRAALRKRAGIKVYYPVQLVLTVLVILAIVLLNYYFFPPRNVFIWVMGTALLAGLIFFAFKKLHRGQKALYLSIALSLVLNFFLNYNFFPSLLKYQGGNELVKRMKQEGIDVPDDKIVLLEIHSHSFDFYRNRNHQVLEMADFERGYPAVSDSYFLLSSGQAGELRAKGFAIEPLIQQPDYNVTTVKLKFLNPATRAKNLDTLMLARIRRS
ncbi:MAG TPA: glycosyltransferase family 39 protein [Flavisolibacter sp.]|nr:glycosyltransferase family 39 protein [Flavisolibacter sp.]